MLLCFGLFIGIPPDFSPNPFHASEDLIRYSEFAKFDCNKHIMNFS